MKTVKIGIFGAGTVGGGVVEILTHQQERFEAAGISLEIAKICVRDAAKKRDFALPASCQVVTDPADILNDPDISLVVELIGGTTLAKEIVFTALEKGKHVVTANKALVSKFLPELEATLAQNTSLQFGFEAAVGGGIPVIHSVQRDLAVDNITKISGIINGTTNFILSKMESEGASYSDVLAEAQDLGYAEADPTADVEGHDARSKILILAKLAFGFFTPEEHISCHGISQISDTDFEYAKFLNATIKLLAVAQKVEDRVSIFVSPVVVGAENSLAQISGATNAVAIESEYLAQTVLVGQGAGRFPTANAVVSDIFSVAQSASAPAFTSMGAPEMESNIEGRFYIRLRITDGVGIIRKVGEICEKYGVSIDSVLQLPIENPENVPFVVTTELTDLSAVQKVCTDLEKESFCREAPLCMPIFK